MMIQMDKSLLGHLEIAKLRFTQKFRQCFLSQTKSSQIEGSVQHRLP